MLSFSNVIYNFFNFLLFRFTIEHNKGLKPAGESYTTADQPPREIPEGYYDTGDGYFDPETKVVFKYDDLNSIVRYQDITAYHRLL